MATNETVTLTAELKDEMSAPLDKARGKVDNFTDAVVDGAKKQAAAVDKSTAQISTGLGKQNRLFGGMKSAIARGTSGTKQLFSGMRRDVILEMGRMRRDAEREGTRTGKGFALGMKGAIVAGVAGIGLGALLATAVGDAMTSSDATDKFKATMNFAGIDTKGIDQATAAAKAYADQTVYDLPTIQNTFAQLASNGIKDYAGLTKAAGNLNAVAGGNAETFKSVSRTLTQSAGAGRLMTEDWNMLADAIPGAAGPLMKALEGAGAYTGNFREAMEKGQITSDEFNAALMTLGTKPVAVEAAKSTKTFEGALGNLSATVNSKLMGALDRIKPAATDAINTLATGFGAAFDWTADAIDKLGQVAAKIWEFRTPIGIIGGLILALFIPHWVALGVAALVSAGKQAAAWAIARGAATRSALVHSFAVLTMVGGWVVMGTQALIQGARIAAGWLLAMGPVGWVILAVGLVIGALVLAYTKIGWFRDGVNAVFQAIGAGIAGAVEWIQRFLWNLATIAVAVWMKIVDLWNGVLKPAIDGLVGWFRDLIGPALDAVKPFIDGLVTGFQGFIDFWAATLKPVIDKIAEAFGWLGEQIKPVTDAIGSFAANPLGGIQDWLGIQKDGNGQGIMPGASGGGVFGFAGGGVLGGYKPGHDSILARLSPGESVLVPELTRAIGPQNIMAANAAASGGRPAGAGPALTSGHSARGGSSTSLSIGQMTFNVPVTNAGQVDLDAMRETAVAALEDALAAHNRRAY